MKAISFILITFLTPMLVTSQDDISSPRTALKQKAIAIENLRKLSNDVYNEIKDYEIIMIGEMHGTNEPAKFAYGICQLITNNEEQVILALEIPGELLVDMNSPLSSDELKGSDFFQMENVDGRNGQAWFDLILESNNNSNIIAETIDNNICSPRDSSMYLDVLRIKKKYPNTKIVTLTGNIHNWLKPFRNDMKLGGFLVNDGQYIQSNKIMSINHLYKEGTMMNNTGDGLKLQTIEGKDNLLNQTVNAKMYLSPQIFKRHNQYTHFLFTEKITHSKELKTGENKR